MRPLIAAYLKKIRDMAVFERGGAEAPEADCAQRSVFRLSAEVAEGPKAEGLEDTVDVLFREHASGLLGGPGTRKALGAVGYPKTGKSHDGGVAVEDVGFDFVERVGGGVMRVFVVGRV